MAGGKPGMRVSWQVTGVRHDEWAAAPDERGSGEGGAAV